MSWELVAAIIAMIAAYFIGRMNGRTAEMRQQRPPTSQPRKKVPQERAPNTPPPRTVRSGFVPVTSLTSAQVREIRNEVIGGRKISAIKIARAYTGLGLKDAKDYVESL